MMECVGPAFVYAFRDWVGKVLFMIKCTALLDIQGLVLWDAWCHRLIQAKVSDRDLGLPSFVVTLRVESAVVVISSTTDDRPGVFERNGFFQQDRI